jgi:predicted regulator of Ras-like GTPase activity (Roadblock/LC7/MglB family)
MFGLLLREMVEGVEGGIASVVMGGDGIALASYSTPMAAIDVDAVGIELGVVFTSLKHAVAMLEAGRIEELSMVAAGLTTVVRALKDDYFVALAIEPRGNLGRARYLLRIHAPEMQTQLDA